ncbi:hypothetical protein [Vibrio parahaemolyticus]|uniref:hypothetical protein n=1 Tax=Vibrio parahaemolyticus TaxID=670 RepID=UPI0028792C86|nr:hypothetical protein [Vibrio parahaemolyticus]MDS1925676.1 hypothetical protein [Vibrio parahaemolyticus]
MSNTYYLVGAIAAVVTLSLPIIDMQDEAEPTPAKELDFSSIQLSNPGCDLKGPDGEAVILREQNGKVLIPKGSTITGECFIVNKPNSPKSE